MKTLYVLTSAVIVLSVFFLIIFLSKDYTSSTLVTDKQIDDDKVIHLRLGHNTPVNSALHQASLRFAKLVEEKTYGNVKVDVYPAQQLGNDHRMVEMARDGELDIILIPTAKMSVAEPSMQYADLPFYFPSRQDLYDMLDGEPGEILLNNLKSIGLVGVTFWENGFKHFTGNKPFLKPDDFKGKKIRVMKSKIIKEQFESLGAQPVAIDFHATKKALEDGVVDGHENPLVAIVSMEFYKVQSHLTLSEHGYLGYVFSISQKVFNKLPQNVREVLYTTAKEVTPWERAQTQKREQEFIKIIKNYGVTVNKISEDERKKFAAILQHIPKEYEDVIGSNVISKTEEILFEKYGAPAKSKENIVIGINADLSSYGANTGLAIKRGVEIAVDEINKEGGLLGKPLKIITKDHRTISARGINNVKELSSREDVVAIIGGKHSANVYAEIHTIQESKVPYLIPWAAAEELTQNSDGNSYIFRASANDKFLSKLLADRALKYGKNIAIIAENSVWGRGSIKGIQARLKQKNLVPISSMVVNKGHTLSQSEIDTLRDKNLSSIIIVLNAIEASNVIKLLQSSKINAPVVSHWGVDGEKFYKNNSTYLNNAKFEFIQSFSFDKNQVAKELKKSYLQKYNKGNSRLIMSQVGVGQAYDLVHLLALAIKKAGSTDRAKVKEALEDLPSYRGAVKFYKKPFTDTRHDALNADDFFFVKYKKGGEVVRVD